MGLTVGVCAYNEEKSVAKALGSVLPQLGGGDEVIVVASGCTDRTVEIVRGVAGKDPRVRLEVEPARRGKAAALNKILSLARNECVVLTDADVLVGPSAVEAIAVALETKGVGAVIGRTVSLQQESFWDKLQDFAWRAFNDLRQRQSDAGNLFALNGYLSAVKKSLVKEPIPEDSLVEDWMLGWGIKEQGYRVVCCPEAIVYVKAAQNLRDYLRQKVRVRVGQLQVTERGMGWAYLRQPSNLGLLLQSPYALPYLALDLVAWALALARYACGVRKWTQVGSSKP